MDAGLNTQSQRSAWHRCLPWSWANPMRYPAYCLKFTEVCNHPHSKHIHDISKHQWVDITFFHPFTHFGHHLFLVSHPQASGSSSGVVSLRQVFHINHIKRQGTVMYRNASLMRKQNFRENCLQHNSTHGPSPWL